MKKLANFIGYRYSMGDGSRENLCIVVALFSDGKEVWQTMIRKRVLGYKLEYNGFDSIYYNPVI